MTGDGELFESRWKRSRQTRNNVTPSGAKVSLEPLAPVSLEPRAALAPGVALHERVAYAVEYGALLVPHGKVAIRREIAHVGGGERRVWRRNEHGGSPIGPPDRQGFSLSMIERSLWRELQGAVTFEFAQAGLRGTLVIRLDPAIASRANARKGRS